MQALPTQHARTSSKRSHDGDGDPFLMSQHSLSTTEDVTSMPAIPQRTASKLSQLRQDPIMLAMLSTRSVQHDLSPEEELEMEERMYVMLRFSKKYKREQVRRANSQWTDNDGDAIHGTIDGHDSFTKHTDYENEEPTSRLSNRTCGGGGGGAGRFRSLSTQPRPSPPIKGMFDVAELDRAASELPENRVSCTSDKLASNRSSEAKRPSQTVGSITFHRIRTFSETPISRTPAAAAPKQESIRSNQTSARSILKKEPTQFSLQGARRSRQTSVNQSVPQRKISFSGIIEEIVILPERLKTAKDSTLTFSQETSADSNSPNRPAVHTIHEEDEEIDEIEDVVDEDDKGDDNISDSDSTESRNTEDDNKLEEARRNRLLNSLPASQTASTILPPNRRQLDSPIIGNSMKDLRATAPPMSDFKTRMKKWAEETDDSAGGEDVVKSFITLGSSRMFGAEVKRSSTAGLRHGGKSTTRSIVERYPPSRMKIHGGKCARVVDDIEPEQEEERLEELANVLDKTSVVDEGDVEETSDTLEIPAESVTLQGGCVEEETDVVRVGSSAVLIHRRTSSGEVLVGGRACQVSVTDVEVVHSASGAWATRSFVAVESRNSRGSDDGVPLDGDGVPATGRKVSLLRKLRNRLMSKLQE